MAQRCLARMREPNLPTDPEASRERFATCRQPDGNREGPIFLSVSTGRRESRPSSWRRWGVFSPICRDRILDIAVFAALVADCERRFGSQSILSRDEATWVARLSVDVLTQSGPDITLHVRYVPNCDID